MRKGRLCVPMIVLCLLLAACGGEGGGSEAEELALVIRGEYLAMTGCTAHMEVTADYGQRVYGYSVDIKGDLKSGTMTVNEPENIAGTVLTWTDGETELEYDGAVLDTGALSQSGLSPADAMPAVLNACRNGTVVDCCSDTLEEQNVLYATLDAGNQDGCQVACWFQPESYALARAEVLQDGQVVITLNFTEFSFQITEEADTK